MIYWTRHRASGSALRTGLFTLLALAGPVLSGCAGDRGAEPTMARQSDDAETQRLRAELQQEQARRQALQEQISSQQTSSQGSQAEVTTLRNRVRELEQNNQRLVGLIEQAGQKETAAPPPPVMSAPADLDAALRDFSKRNQGRVWYDPGQGAVSFAGDKMFDSGSDQVSKGGQAVIGELADIAKRYLNSGWELMIVGHSDTDSIRTPDLQSRHPTNWHLAVHRAIAVRSLLVSVGVPDRKIGIAGFGPNRPVSTDKAKNRRVEVFFLREGAAPKMAPVREG